MDGTTGAIQDRMRAKCKLEWHHMMLQMNLWSSVYLIISEHIFTFVLFFLILPMFLVISINFYGSMLSDRTSEGIF